MDILKILIYWVSLLLSFHFNLATRKCKKNCNLACIIFLLDSTCRVGKAWEMSEKMDIDFGLGFTTQKLCDLGQAPDFSEPYAGHS